MTMASGPDRPSEGTVEAYVRQHVGHFTDDAIYATLVAAGHPPDAVRAALAAVPRSAPVTPRAVRAVFGAYVGVFVLLSLGMLLNSRPAGYLMPSGPGGIGLLGVSLAVAFGLSLLWIASRRAFVILAAILIGLSFLSSLSGGTPILQVVLVAAAVGVVLFLARRGSAAGPRVPATMGLLLVMPILMLLGVAGICVASGLPIPGGV